MEKLRKVWIFIKNNTASIGITIVSILLFLFCFSWYSKNKKIKKLQVELAVLQARLKLKSLAVKYDSLIENLNELQKKDKELQEKMKKIGDSLQEKLSEGMSVPEIVARFKEIGLLRKS